MKVLYVIDSLANGGAERSLASMVPHYAAAGLELEVAALRRSDRGVAREIAAHVPVHEVPAGSRLAQVRSLRRLLTEVAPQIVHSTLFEADLATRLAVPRNGPVIVTSLVNDSYGPAQRAAPGVAPWKVEVARWIDLGSARRVRRFHAISSHVSATVGKRLRLPAERVEVIPRGRDAGTLGARTADRRGAARACLGLAPGQPLVLAAARHEHQKGLDVLIAAMPALRVRHPDVRIVVAGRHGGATELLRGPAADVGVELLGDRSDVPELLCAADVFALPSRWEGAGSVLVEAMALSCPIVVSDLPATREMVAGAGVFVPPDRPSALADGLATVLDEPEAAATRAADGLQRFRQHHDVVSVVARLARFYERAMM